MDKRKTLNILGIIGGLGAAMVAFNGFIDFKYRPAFKVEMDRIEIQQVETEHRQEQREKFDLERLERQQRAEGEEIPEWLIREKEATTTRIGDAKRRLQRLKGE